MRVCHSKCNLTFPFCPIMMHRFNFSLSRTTVFSFWAHFPLILCISKYSKLPPPRNPIYPDSSIYLFVHLLHFYPALPSKVQGSIHQPSPHSCSFTITLWDMLGLREGSWSKVTEWQSESGLPQSQYPSSSAVIPLIIKFWIKSQVGLDQIPNIIFNIIQIGIITQICTTSL